MLKVLIAEDNLILADILEDYLISSGFEVCGVVSSVDEAVAMADLTQPDLAVLDFRLADGGYGSQVRARLKYKNSMGILYASGDPLYKLCENDGEAYIQKPYGLNDLVCSLRIVREIMISGSFSQNFFPNGFHLLKNSSDESRKTE